MLQYQFGFVAVFTGLFSVASLFTPLSAVDFFLVFRLSSRLSNTSAFWAVVGIFCLLSESSECCLHGLAVSTVGLPVAGVRRWRRGTSDVFGRGLISAIEMKTDDVGDCSALLPGFTNSIEDAGSFICALSVCTSGSVAEKHR